MEIIKKHIPLYCVFSWVLGALTIYWLFNRYAYIFFGIIYLALIFAVIMYAYLMVAWHRMAMDIRWDIGFCIAAWIFLAYAVIRADGLIPLVLIQ